MEQIPHLLSVDGILRIKTEADECLFYFQILDITEISPNQFSANISDGFLKIVVGILSQAYNKVISKTVKNFDIVKIKKKNIIRLTDKVQNYRITDLTVVYDTIPSAIGNPASIQQFKMNKFNPLPGAHRIINRFSSDEYITKIVDLIDYVNQNNSNISFKGTLIQKSKIVQRNSSFFNIKIKDQQHKIINGVFFDETAKKFYNVLELNKTYIFSKFLIKKNKLLEGFEIKFFPNSEIKEVEKQIDKENQNMNIQTNNLIVSKFSQIYGLAKNEIVNIIAIITKRFEKKDFIILKLIDQKNASIQLIIWNQMKATLKLDDKKNNQYYLFINLRINIYNDIKSLHSTKAMQIYNFQNAKQLYQIDLPQKKPGFSFESLNQLKKHDTISSIKQRSISISNQKVYYYVSAILQITAYYEQYKSIFYVFCKSCNMASPRLGEDRKCIACKSNDFIIKYKLRTKLLDCQDEIKCALNDQIAEELIGCTPQKGLELYFDKPQQLKQRIESLNYGQYLLKINSRLYNGVYYYNILNAYRRNIGLEIEQALNFVREQIYMRQRY